MSSWGTLWTSFPFHFSFRATYAIGYKTYYVRKTENTFIDQIVLPKELETWETPDVIANVGYYPGSGEEPQPSGAYIFRYSTICISNNH